MIRTAEVLIGVVIAGLALRLLVRWRRGYFRAHEHCHELPAPPGRTPWASYGIGLVHGMGGSAGVGVLLLASVKDELVAVAALLLFAVFTALSMTVASTLFGSLLARGRIRRRFSELAPAVGAAGLAFGVWYGLGALDAVPYAF